MRIKKVLEEKKAWQSYRARIKALPQDYRILFGEIEKYLTKVCYVQGQTCDSILPGVLVFFEESAASGKRAQEIIGTDVAAFCDGLL